MSEKFTVPWLGLLNPHLGALLCNQFGFLSFPWRINRPCWCTRGRPALTVLARCRLPRPARRADPLSTHGLAREGQRGPEGESFLRACASLWRHEPHATFWRSEKMPRGAQLLGEVRDGLLLLSLPSLGVFQLPNKDLGGPDSTVAAASIHRAFPFWIPGEPKNSDSCLHAALRVSLHVLLLHLPVHSPSHRQGERG